MAMNPARAALLAFLDHLTVPCVVVATPLGEGQPPQVFHLEPEHGDAEQGISEDVLRFLEDRGAPLTVNQLLECFEAEGTEISDRTIKRHLRQLVESGKVDRPRSDGPPGYRRSKRG
jgi:DNA-binding transcriptional ArsR family regulator